MLTAQVFKLNLRRLRKNRVAAVATEYAFVIAFIGIVAASGMGALGNSLSSFYNTVGEGLANLACAMPDTASDSGKENSNKCK